MSLLSFVWFSSLGPWYCSNLLFSLIDADSCPCRVRPSLCLNTYFRSFLRRLATASCRNLSERAVLHSSDLRIQTTRCCGLCSAGHFSESLYWPTGCGTRRSGRETGARSVRADTPVEVDGAESGRLSEVQHGVRLRADSKAHSTHHLQKLRHHCKQIPAHSADDDEYSLKFEKLCMKWHQFFNWVK